MTKKEKLLELGFEELPHWTVGGTIIYKLGRNRELGISSINTPCELVTLMEIDPETKIGTDLIVLSNFDYDGYMTLKDICCVLYGITKKPKFLI